MHACMTDPPSGATDLLAAPLTVLARLVSRVMGSACLVLFPILGQDSLSLSLSVCGCLVSFTELISCTWEGKKGEGEGD